MNVNSIQSGKLELLPRCERLECPLYQKQRKTILDNLYNLDHPNFFIWMMSNDDPVFLSTFIEYLDNNY